MLAAEGDARGAAAAVEAVITTNPKESQAHFMHGQLSLVLGQRARARESLETALRQSTTHGAARIALVSLFLEDKQDQAAEALLGDQELKQLNHDPRMVLSKAAVELRRGALGDARARVATVLRAQPAHAAARLLAGEIEFRDKRLADAETHLRTAVATGRDPLARQLLAATRLQQGRPTKALEDLQPLLAGASIDVRSLRLAAEAHLAEGNLERATQLFQAPNRTAATMPACCIASARSRWRRASTTAVSIPFAPPPARTMTSHRQTSPWSCCT